MLDKLTNISITLKSKAHREKKIHLIHQNHQSPQKEVQTAVHFFHG